MPIALQRNTTTRNNNNQIHQLNNNNNMSPPHASDDDDGSYSSTSIGMNSSDDISDDDDEVHSCFKGPLDTMDVLEQVLPIKKGISKFYNGKSKSFTSLADISDVSSSAKDLAKPKNPFNKKRKNLLVNRHLDMQCLPPLHPQVNERHGFHPEPEAPRCGTPWRSFSYSDLQSVAVEIQNRPGGIP
ncbi:hypothetical protein ACFE04_016811 [Oxalis oulophora]